jgi:hypothetical protein
VVDVSLRRCDCALQFDGALQYKAYIDYSLTNPYHPLINSSQATSYLKRYNEQCLPELETCTSTSTDAACKKADDTCFNQIEGSIQAGADFDVYDLRAPSQDPFPPQTYISYLQNATIQSKIGAQHIYQACSNAPFDKFGATGDGKLSSPVSANLIIITQFLVLSYLLSIRFYSAIFKCSSGRVTPVILLHLVAMRSQSDTWLTFFSFVSRLDLQYRWCAGGPRPTAIRPICRI